MSAWRRCAAAVAVALMAGALTPAEAGAQAPGTPAVTNGWNDGFVIQSADGDYRVQVGLLLQADQRWAFDDPQNNVIDALTFRRIRPILQGRAGKYFDFYFNPDFAGAIVNIRDAYFETRFSQAFRIRVGKGKTPFGLERLQGAGNLIFVERALPTAVAPDRDVGIQAVGDVSGGLVSYAGGVFNGVADGGSSETDTNDGKDLAGRIVVRPFVKHGRSPLAGLGLAIAGSTGTQPTATPTFPSSSRQIFVAYDHAADGAGVRNRFSPQWFYYHKSVGAFGEYVHTRGAIAKGAVTADITHESLLIAGSVVVTGETASDRGVRPAHAFDPGKHTWGALQLTGRYHTLTVDPQAAVLGLLAAGSSHEAKAFTIGANWYLNPQVKWVLNFERTVFDGNPDGPRHAENALLVRSQISF